MPGAILKLLATTTVLANAIGFVIADPNDWVNVNYIVQRKAASDRSTTVNAQTSIIGGASSTAMHGPWTVTNSKGVLPPSKNPHDYLSFAPYHWADCNWCGRGATHLANPGAGDDNGSDSDPPDPDSPPDNSDPYPDGGDMDYAGSNKGDAEAVNDALDAMSAGDARKPAPVNVTTPNSAAINSTIAANRRRGLRRIAPKMRMQKVRSGYTRNVQKIKHEGFDSSMDSSTDSWTSTWSDAPEDIQTSSLTDSWSDPSTASPPPPSETRLDASMDVSSTSSMSSKSATTMLRPSESAADFPQAPIGGPPPFPTGLPIGVLPPPGDSTHTSDHIVNGTPAPAEAPAKTQKPSCKPSPTSSLAPSATWTTCPYVGRDGQVNPDVRLLNGPEAINSASQSIIYNAIAYALQKTSSYSTAATSFIDTFFLNPSTKMNPNMDFGQMVRGPGQAGQDGTFTGVLDLRGIVKIINGIMILKAADSPDWTAARDQELAAWMAQYADWLQNSLLGKRSASRPNNHATFYVSQVIATKVLAGDISGATAAAQDYFSHQFLDQVAASGEQPFEAVRTRPFHYRCFNLEAMITNAKIGDQLGLNLWAVKSKYGATIQTALDYTMRLNPKTEDVLEILPHVAAVAAAYGDPKGLYADFMRKTMFDYQSKSFWLYDQTGALPSSPAAQNMHKRAGAWGDKFSHDRGASFDGMAAATPTPPIPFECPAVFALAEQVEIDNGIFVTCDELKPFYQIVLSI